MLYTLICLLLLAILGTGGYFAAHYVVSLQMSYKALQADHEDAKTFIGEQAEVINSYEFERNELQKRLDYRAQKISEDNGWNQFDMNR